MDKGHIKPIRTIYFDYLRVYAILAVIIIHVSAQNWYSVEIEGPYWQVFNFFDSIARWGVPVFVMISGSLFINKDVSLKQIYTKYIFRLLFSFFIWAVIYALFADGTIVNRKAAIIQGHYHMWFIPMMIGIYMCIPIIKSIVQNDNRSKYFLALSFIFAFLIPEMIALFDDFGHESIKIYINAFCIDINSMSLHIPLGFVSYFVLGYYLDKIHINMPLRITIYIFGILGFISTICLEILVTSKTHSYRENYYGNFTINVLFEAIAVFTLFKYRTFNRNKLNVFVQKLSKYSFGAFLVHALVLELLNEVFGINTLSFHPILAIFCISIVVFLVSFMISAILNHIPILKKYMV